MKLTHPKCPECGELAQGAVEVVAGLAQMIVNDDGTWDYEGYTDVWWDEQKGVYEADRLTLEHYYRDGLADATATVKLPPPMNGIGGTNAPASELNVNPATLPAT